MEVVQGKHRTYTRKSLVGEVFGKLTVLAEHNPTPGKTRRWRCRCACGNETISQQGHLVVGQAKSCRPCRTVRHGQSRKGKETPEYRAWKGMMGRCYQPRVERFPHYGGRGIVVCERWHLFENFFADMGARPSARHSVDRVDRDGNYEPTNCRWATPTEQMRNHTRARMITAFGRTQALAAWAEERGLPDYTIARRIDRGETPEHAMGRPR